MVFKQMQVDELFNLFTYMHGGTRITSTHPSTYLLTFTFTSRNSVFKLGNAIFSIFDVQFQKWYSFFLRRSAPSASSSRNGIRIDIRNG